MRSPGAWWHAVAAAMGVAAGASGATLCVATNGADAGARDSWSSAYASIQSALNSAASGDVIAVAGHVFALTNQLSWTSSFVTVRGGYAATNDADVPGARDAARWPTVITRAGGGMRLLVAGRVTNGVLEGVSLTGGSLAGLAGAGRGGAVFASNCVGLLIADCSITNNALSDNSGARGGGVYQEGGSLTLSNCVIRDNAAFGAGNGQVMGAGVHVASGTGTLVNSVFAHNTGATGVNPAQGGAVWSSGALQLRNCLLAGNVVAHGGSAVQIAGGSARIESCTIAYNYLQGIGRSGGTLSVTNSILWANGDDVTGVVALGSCDVEDGDAVGTNGCLSADPRFEFGFYLGSGSPCVDAGGGLAGDLGLDARTTRTDGGGDAGAADLGYHPAEGFDTSYADIYVASGGSDANSGTNIAQPLGTITRALSIARDGSRIHVLAGRYTGSQETMPLQVSGLAGLQVLGEGWGTTIVDALSRTRVLTITDNLAPIRIEGLSITGGRTNSVTIPHPDTGDGGGVFIRDCADVLIGACAITNNSCSDSVSAFGGGISAQSSGLTISNSIVAANTASGAGNGVGYGGGVAIQSGSLRLWGCELAENAALAVGKAGFGAAVYSAAGSAQVRNSLVRANPVAYAIGGAVYGKAGWLSVESCTLAYNGVVGICRTGGVVAVTNSILWGNGDDVAGAVALSHCDVENGDSNGVNGCISADPGFEFGFRLADGSPCVDAGTNASAAWGLDSLTTRRDGGEDGGRVDLGYHYPAGAVPGGYAEIYVSPSGDDAHAGTNWAEAFRTITRALAAAVDGSAIHVGPGLYTNGLERFPLVAAGRSGLRIAGSGSADCVVNAMGAGRVLELKNNSGRVRVEGMTFMGGRTNDVTPPYANTGDGAGLYIDNCGDLTVAGCVIADNSCSDSVFAQGGGVRIAASVVTLSNCVIRGNSANGAGNGLGQGGGIALVSGSLACRECVVVSNRTTNYGYGGGIYSAGSGRIRNALVARNASTTLGDGIYVAGGTLGCDGLTVADNSGEGIVCAGGSLSVSNAIVWGNGDDVTGRVDLAYCDIEDGDSNGVSGCFSEDPLFADTVYYHEESGTGVYTNGYFGGGGWGTSERFSPCIDRGWPGSAWGREPRPSGMRLNVGAYGDTPVASMSRIPSGVMIVVQ